MGNESQRHGVEGMVLTHNVHIEHTEDRRNVFRYTAVIGYRDGLGAQRIFVDSHTTTTPQPPVGTPVPMVYRSGRLGMA